MTTIHQMPPPQPVYVAPTVCKECHTSDPEMFQEDPRTADLICTKCGVVAGRLVSEETEWRDFEEDEVSKSRVGAAMSIYGTATLETHIAGYNKGACTTLIEMCKDTALFF
jgi:transcription initiation factor TFIIIB Brf1 subunit/transcription initiation factor TFIIB